MLKVSGKYVYKLGSEYVVFDFRKLSKNLDLSQSPPHEFTAVINIFKQLDDHKLLSFQTSSFDHLPVGTFPQELYNLVRVLNRFP